MCIKTFQDKELSAAVEKAVSTEWQRRVEIEKERMVLEEKLAELQRYMYITLVEKKEAFHCFELSKTTHLFLD